MFGKGGKRRHKISVIGAGNVGREVAAWCAIKELGDIVIWNRSRSKATGIALDLIEAGPLVGYDSRIIGTDDVRDTKDSDVILFTAGFPRKPGMLREELVAKNAEIIEPLVRKLVRVSPNAILVMLTNPLDVMTYVAYRASKFNKRRVIGMGGVLDSSRFASFIAKELSVSRDRISALVIGSHGENMVPLVSLATVGGVRLDELLDRKRIDRLIHRTKEAGAEIVKLLEANASFSVGAAAASVAQAIIFDKREIMPNSVLLNGQYGLKNVFIGVPCIIGANGIEKVIEVDLTRNEKTQLRAAAIRVKEMIDSV